MDWPRAFISSVSPSTAPGLPLVLGIFYGHDLQSQLEEATSPAVRVMFARATSGSDATASSILTPPATPPVWKKK
jgi:hypothetical protein